MPVPRLRHLFALMRRTFDDFLADDCMTLSAALAYYALFSLPPLLTLAVLVASVSFEEAQAQDRVIALVDEFIGSRAAEQFSTMMANVEFRLGARTAAAAVGIAVVLFTSTTAFVQLQNAINRSWGVTEATMGGVLGLVVKRAISFAVVLGVGALLFLSMAATAIVGAVASHLPALPLAPSALRVIDASAAFIVTSAVVMVLFKVLPDARVRWRDAAVGGLFTAFLFGIHRGLINLYFSKADVGSVFGSAGSVAIILLWFYLAAAVLLFGAEFTHNWSKRYGAPIEPGRRWTRRRRREAPKPAPVQE